MKIRHRVPPCAVAASDPVTPEYQAEVDLTVARAEAAYRKAEKRLHAAETRLAKARQRQTVKARQVAELELLVELRRAELENYRRLMVSVGQPAVNRGRKSFRPVGFGGS